MHGIASQPLSPSPSPRDRGEASGAGVGHTVQTMRVPARTSLPRRQRGFTLIELLTVTAVAGTVSTLAMPALIDVHAQAEQAALLSMAAAAGSAMLLNQAGCLVSDGQPAPGKCLAINDCQQVPALLTTALPTGYRVLAQPLSADGVSAPAQTCQLQRDSDGLVAGFYGVAAVR